MTLLASLRDIVFVTLRTSLRMLRETKRVFWKLRVKNWWNFIWVTALLFSQIFPYHFAIWIISYSSSFFRKQLPYISFLWFLGLSDCWSRLLSYRISFSKLQPFFCFLSNLKSFYKICNICTCRCEFCIFGACPLRKVFDSHTFFVTYEREQ